MLAYNEVTLQQKIAECEALGISVYESDYGFGYTYCDADIYSTFDEALNAAYLFIKGQ